MDKNAIKELREQLSAIEVTVAKILFEFEEGTGLFVKDISYTRHHVEQHFGADFIELRGSPRVSIDASINKVDITCERLA